MARGRRCTPGSGAGSRPESGPGCWRPCTRRRTRAASWTGTCTSSTGRRSAPIPMRRGPKRGRQPSPRVQPWRVQHQAPPADRAARQTDHLDPDADPAERGACAHGAAAHRPNAATPTPETGDRGQTGGESLLAPLSPVRLPTLLITLITIFCTTPIHYGVLLVL